MVAIVATRIKINDPKHSKLDYLIHLEPFKSILFVSLSCWNYCCWEPNEFK
jgi:hypothetical protein